MNDLTGLGLGEDWDYVEQALREVIPVYDRTNRFISLGSDLKIRKSGLELLKQFLGNDPEILVLDLGCGTGRMTNLFGRPAVMLDALGPMIRVAKKRNPNAEGIIGVFENLPLRSRTIQGVMTGFAIRDARRLNEALREINQALVRGGLLLIADLSKPESNFKSGLIALYWKIFAPLIALAVSGRKGLKFAALSNTYQKLPKKSVFLELTKKTGFRLIASRYFMLGGASVLLLKKHD